MTRLGYQIPNFTYPGVDTAGLFDVVLHPKFGENHLLYLTYAAGTDSANATRVMRARFDGAALLDAKAGLPAQFDGLSVPQFIAAGGIVLACNLALTLDVAPKFKARDKSTDEAAHKAAVAALIPGVILQPSGVFAAIRAQQVGCTYVRAS